MNKKKMINNIMMVSLIIVFLTGMMMHPLPFTWVKILHCVSGLALTVSALIHMGQTRSRKKVECREQA